MPWDGWGTVDLGSEGASELLKEKKKSFGHLLWLSQLREAALKEEKWVLTCLDFALKRQ